MKLCLISSNIRFDNPADGANAWPHRRFNLARTLLDQKPDIIATQEGRYSQLKEFESVLGEFEIIDQHRSWIKERMYPTFFLRKGKFEILKSEDLWLSETPDVAGSLSFESAFPRLMTWVKVQPKGSKTNFLFVNTHLDHIKHETRERQIAVFSEQIKRIQDPNTILMICGDFNDSPESSVRQILLGHFPDLQDAWKLFHQEEQTSHHAFNGECQNGARIDWVLADKRVEIEKCEMEKRSFEGRYPSDHFPIICEFKF